MAEKEKLQVIEVYIQASIQSEINTSPWRHNVFILMSGQMFQLLISVKGNLVFTKGENPFLDIIFCRWYCLLFVTQLLSKINLLII